MPNRRFKGGIHPDYKKWMSNTQPIVAAPIPSRLDVPVVQHLGVPATPIVKEGDEVVPGQLIAQAPTMISANVHAPAAGRVARVVKRPIPGGSVYDHIQIETDTAATARHEWQERKIDFDSIDRKWAVTTMREAGIVGMGGATFPTDVKYSPPPTARLDTLIINGAECEPYLTCDHRVMVEHASEIIDGISILQAAIGFDQIAIGIERNKPDALAAIGAAVSRNRARGIQVMPLPVRYPQGAEKLLIRSVTGRTVPAGGLPFEVGVVVSNVQTVLAFQQAARLGKPLIDRVATVSGAGIHNPRNLRVLVGTPFSDLADQCGGFSEQTRKIVVGGPMTGAAIPSLDYVVTKGFSGLLFLTQREYPEEAPCIRCGTCVDVCPMQLMPLKLAALAKAGRFAEAKATRLADCFECGSCSWSCPSHIKIASWIKFAKSYIREKSIA